MKTFLPGGALLAFMLFGLLSIQPLKAHSQRLQSVAHVDISRYAGKWYEIASFPQRFQRNCQGTTAEYTICDNGTVLVTNRCRKGSLTGPEDEARGKAFVIKNTGNARLKVQFRWPFKGKYWIIELADDYSHAVVAHPNRKYLWILCRKPHMDEATYKGILDRLQVRGFDITKLKRTPQM